MPRKKKPPVSFEGVVIQDVDAIAGAADPDLPQPGSAVVTGDPHGVMRAWIAQPEAMTVTFTGDPRGGANPNAIELGGKTFPLGKAVMVNDVKWIATFGGKVRRNGHFEVG